VVAHQGEDLLGGSEITFESLLSQGMPVVLNYWAALCPPCLVEMPWFQAAYEQHADSVLLIGIDVGQFTGLGTTEQGAELLADLDITYPAGYAVDDKPLRQHNVTNMPFTVFFDEAGTVVGNHAGIMTEQQIHDWFATLAAGAE
jgi:thiol-disulfide isomerase/thioredoxin